MKFSQDVGAWAVVSAVLLVLGGMGLHVIHVVRARLRARRNSAFRINVAAWLRRARLRGFSDSHDFRR